MKIMSAKALARLVSVLVRLKIVDLEYAISYIDYLQVLVFRSETKKP